MGSAVAFIEWGRAKEALRKLRLEAKDDHSPELQAKIIDAEAREAQASERWIFETGTEQGGLGRR